MELGQQFKPIPIASDAAKLEFFTRYFRGRETVASDLHARPLRASGAR